MKIAILLSGHFRNIEETLQNFKHNLVDPLNKIGEVDIFIHSWDDVTWTAFGSNLNILKKKEEDQNWYEDKVSCENVKKIFEQNNLKIKDILLENQNIVANNYDVENWLILNAKNRTIHNESDLEYTLRILRGLFYQYYGHEKTLNLVLNSCLKYTHIIKTRPDMLYEKFDVKCLELDNFFPFSHQGSGLNINQLFFGGKSESMIKILSYWREVVYKNNELNLEILDKYHMYDVNLNQIFRFYVETVLKIKPNFIQYNPKIYRSFNEIITIK